MKAGDVVVRVEGHPVNSVENLYGELETHDSGDTVEVLVRRDNREQKLRVELSGERYMSGFALRLPPSARSPLGRDDVEDLRRQMRELRRELDDLRNELRSPQRR